MGAPDNTTVTEHNGTRCEPVRASLKYIGMFSLFLIVEGSCLFIIGNSHYMSAAHAPCCFVLALPFCN